MEQIIKTKVEHIKGIYHISRLIYDDIAIRIIQIINPPKATLNNGLLRTGMSLSSVIFVATFSCFLNMKNNIVNESRETKIVGMHYVLGSQRMLH